LSKKKLSVEERKQKNNERLRLYMRNRYLSNQEVREKDRLYYKNIASKKNFDLKLEVFSHYSKEVTKSDEVNCACCGYLDFRFLTLDHIKSRKNVPIEEKRLNGIKLWKYLKEKGLPTGYQVLCFNCNMGKGDREWCPHQLDKITL
jgi:hypothetical protein